jgi:expansin (peptidoglycan-binding protein)
MHPSTALSLIALSASSALASPVPGDHKRQYGGGDNNSNYAQQDRNHGAMTYYEVGVGACGHDDSGKGDSENIVAMSSALMGSGSGEYCGRKVRIQGKDGTAVMATVRDKCPSCEPDELDVSNKVFKEVVGNLGVGRSKVSWSFVPQE